MNSNLAPEYWHTTTLGSVIELTYGKSLPAKSRDGVSCPVFGSNGEVGKHSIPLVKKPGLIVGRKGSFGEVHISEKPFFPIDTTYYIDKFHEQPIRYWFYQLRFLPLNQLNRATAIPGLNREDAYSQEIALPPLAEQKAIADKLDTLLAQVETTQARLERIPQILKRFRQSVLAAAVSGKLTEEWRNEVDRSEWSDAQLDKVCNSISDGDHQAPPRAQVGIPFLVISNVTSGEINFENVSRWVPEAYYNSLKNIRKPNKGDLLYTVTGSFGIPVVVNTDQSFCFQRHIAIIKPNHDVVSTRYLAFYLQSPKAFAYATSVATGTAQKTVSLNNLRNFSISLPTMEEQTEVVRRVDELFAHADRIEQQVNNALARVNNLTQSILAKAFRGELTEQWRKDNPELISGENSAEALLERIQAERAAVAGKKKPRKVVKKVADGD